MKAREHVDKIYGTENMEDVSEFMIPLSSAITMMENHASKVNELPIHAVTPRFAPQPEQIRTVMTETLKGREIDDEFGFIGEWRVDPKNVLDLIIDLQNEG